MSWSWSPAVSGTLIHVFPCLGKHGMWGLHGPLGDRRSACASAPPRTSSTSLRMIICFDVNFSSAPRHVACLP